MADAGAPTGAVTLDYASPPEDLRPYLSIFYEFRADVPMFEDTDKADLAQFRFMLSGVGEYRFADGHVQIAPAIQIVGPTTGPTYGRLSGPVHVFGVGLLPAGWGTLLDFEASLLVNRVIDATELFGTGLRMTANALKSATTLDEKVAIGSALARELTERGKSAAFDFTRIVDEWLESSPSPDVDQLIVATGLSRRQVERRCNAYYGSPPKLLARKYRALRATIALAQGKSNADALLDGGFYDQSHFIREIKAFTGVTPTKISEDLPTLTALTMKRSTFAELSPMVTKN
jgi:AraC-like DNA-binding protein